MRLLSALAATLTIATAPIATSAFAGDSAGPIGLWLTEDGSAVVQMSTCGPALCGMIVWSQKPADARGHVLCGRAVLGDVVKSGADSWGKGWVYSPKTDGKYPVALTLPGDGKLRLHISAGPFGRDQIWTRPP
jgi:uncharacterized protein (DUF2147 family)